MEMIAHEKYILMSLDRKKLKKNGFRYNRGMSDYDCDFYSLKFPALQYDKSTTVDGEIIADMRTGEIRLNAYNYGTKNYYPPFYKNECSEVYKPIIEKINSAFYNMFNKIGIIKSEESKCQI